MKRPAFSSLAKGAAAEPVDLDQLYRTERPALVRFLSRNRAAAHESEDLAQEAFLRLTRAQAGAAPVASPASYLRQIGRNLLRDRARSALSRPAVENGDVARVACGQDELRRLEARDSLRRLEAAMHCLKPRSRDIFLAHRLDGMSYIDIAEQTGLSVKRIEKIMSKAIADLSRLLEHDA